MIVTRSDIELMVRYTMRLMKLYKSSFDSYGWQVIDVYDGMTCSCLLIYAIKKAQNSSQVKLRYGTYLLNHMTKNV